VKVESADRLESVGSGPWDDVLAAARLRSPFLSWTWQAHWAAAFAADRRLDVRRVVDADGALVGVLPLYEATSGVLELVGGADVSDYLDLLAPAGREAEAWSALLRSRVGGRERWVLHAVPGASPTVRALPALAGSSGLGSSTMIVSPFFGTHCGARPPLRPHRTLPAMRTWTRTETSTPASIRARGHCRKNSHSPMPSIISRGQRPGRPSAGAPSWRQTGPA